MLKLSNDQKKLRRKILQIIYDGKTSHIGSCLSAIDVIDAIYSVKKESEKFVLSNGHAAVALYAVLEKRGYLKNPSLSREVWVRDYPLLWAWHWPTKRETFSA